MGSSSEVYVKRIMLTRGLGSSTAGAVHTLWTVVGCDSEEDLHWGNPNAYQKHKRRVTKMHSNTHH
jgi:hypothetical protein